jgi:hypothetical protein
MFVSATFSLSRSAAPQGGMSDDWYEGKPGSAGSPVNLVTHTVSVTIRSDSF